MNLPELYTLCEPVDKLARADSDKSKAQWHINEEHLPDTPVQKAYHQLAMLIRDQEDKFNADTLANQEGIGLSGIGDSHHRKNAASYRPCRGVVSHYKGGKLYVKFDHLDEPRLCNRWKFDDEHIPATPKLIKLAKQLVKDFAQ